MATDKLVEIDHVNYISREAVFELIDNAPIIAGNENESLISAPELSDKVYCLPAADVRPVVRGKWIKYAPHNSDMMTCSECEKYWILDGYQYEFNFFPSCGAEMENPMPMFKEG